MKVRFWVKAKPKPDYEKIALMELELGLEISDSPGAWVAWAKLVQHQFDFLQFQQRQQ